MISLPSHNVSAPAGLAWLDATTPHTESWHMEKQLVQMAVLPVHWLDAITPDPGYEGLLCDAAARPRAGGVAV